MATRKQQLHTPKFRVGGVTTTTSTGPEYGTKIAAESPTEERISALAYELWIQRGCPIGTPEEDWCRAEEQLNQRKTLTATDN